MDLREFEKTARTVWQEIPDEYKAGVDGLVVDRNVHTHPEHDDFFTLGECLTETYPSDFGGPDTTRSAVVLYYGSFRALADENDEFDWEQEIHETLLHELQHHLEHLAADDTLGDFDYAVEENYHRVEGEPFDPLFYRAGQLIGPDTYQVEEDVFMELRVRTTDAIEHVLEWNRRSYRVQIPASDADIQFVVLEEEMPGVPGDLCVVRVKQKGVLGTLRAAFSGQSVEEVLVPVEANP